MLNIQCEMLFINHLKECRRCIGKVVGNNAQYCRLLEF